MCTLIRVKRTIRHGGVGGESWMYYVSTSLWGNSRQNCHKVSPRGLDLHHWLCSSQKPTQFSLSFFFFFFSPRPQISFQILFSFYTCFRSSFLEVPWPKLFCYYLANYNLFSIFELRIYFLAILVSNLVDIRTKIFSEIFRSRNLQKILLLGNFQDSFCFLFAVGTTLPTTLA